MHQKVRRKLVRLLALGSAAVPLGFGALRALTTGTDFRYLVTALASLAAAATIFRLGASRVRSRWRLGGIGLAGSTLVAAAVAFGQGATSAPAVWVVAVAFSLCVTTSGMLGLFSRSAA
jgi:4-amino-4-deoxy-L-arabinose transferase-like glycosyltransferase